MPTIVAYLDVLGFSGYTEEDFAGALRLLSHQEFILRLKLQDKTLHPLSNYSDPSLAAVAEAHLVDSFKHFLPFSDSIFIVSETPDKFARQLSHFLIECFLFGGHIYDRTNDPARPEVVKITDFPSGNTHHQHWYPYLLRGGLASGELVAGGVTGIEGEKESRIPNLAGPAVAKAVWVEKSPNCRGPRLFCEAGFEKNFGKDIQPYFRDVTNTISELLWPAFAYNLNNDSQIEMTEFHDMWGPALALWKSKRGHPAFEHYDEFLKLIVRSFLCWAEIARCTTEARRVVRRWMAQDLSEELVERFLR